MTPPYEDTVPCDICGGMGAVPEDHGYGTAEWLGCPDCRGTGMLHVGIIVPYPAENNELPGMWEDADLSGGWADSEDEAADAIRREVEACEAEEIERTDAAKEAFRRKMAYWREHGAPPYHGPKAVK